VDLVVCSALGVDMYDCVYPTRTAVSVHMLVGGADMYALLRGLVLPWCLGDNCS